MSSSMVIAVFTGFPTPPRLSQWGGGVTSQLDVFLPDRPSPVQVLPHQDLLMGIRASRRTGRDIDRQTAQADGIVVGHDRLVSESDQAIPVGGFDGTESGAGLLRGYGEASIEAGDEGCFQPGVGDLDVGNAGQG
jgi:hypothetical protein